jgi:hypothetical protein
MVESHVIRNARKSRNRPREKVTSFAFSQQITLNDAY